jgi:CarD family transcriptional regulator
MKFVVGETVVYPHHGAAKIIEISEKKFPRGEVKMYLTLEIIQRPVPESADSKPGTKVMDSTLVIKVPVDSVTEVGVRDVIDKKGVEAVFSVLREPFIEEPTNWSRRFKANTEKINTGDVLKVSEVVRDLWRRDQDKPISAGEKRMLAKARQILVSELALAKKSDELKAGALLDEVLASS